MQEARSWARSCQQVPDRGGQDQFAHELAAALRGLGRPTTRASMDDFKHRWRHASQHGYDRVSGEGYYRNAYDFTSAHDLLLHPQARVAREGIAVRA
jgi:uridine kinase